MPPMTIAATTRLITYALVPRSSGTAMYAARISARFVLLMFIGRPPRLRLSPLRCPPRGRNSRLGAARWRSSAPPRGTEKTVWHDEQHQQEQRHAGELLQRRAGERYGQCFGYAQQQRADENAGHRAH